MTNNHFRECIFLLISNRLDLCIVTNPFSRKYDKYHYAKCIKPNTFPKKVFFGKIQILAPLKSRAVAILLRFPIITF